MNIPFSPTVTIPIVHYERFFFNLEKTPDRHRFKERNSCKPIVAAYIDVYSCLQDIDSCCEICVDNRRAAQYNLAKRVLCSNLFGHDGASEGLDRF